ncbi:hypothetical protein C1646_774145 [Rhizophagus diaphanus]|nr:hypothetical protein C1646_774145 [Rhizophagus diaphanus] [Rhizophagus sp. MUCL 43196]
MPEKRKYWITEAVGRTRTIDAFKLGGAPLEGKGAKPIQNPSYVTLFQAYPAQRNRPKTRSTPYLNKEVIEDESARDEPQYAPIPIPIQTTNNVGEGEPMTVDAKEQSTEIKRKKATVQKKKTPKVQPSITAHIPPYNIVADLQQQRANITFGQLFQISPKLRSDVGKSLRKPTTRSAKFAHQDVQSTTAMYCDAMIKRKRIPLIIDIGAAGSIVTCQLLNNLGIAID